MRENNLLNKKDLSALFSNLEQIYGLNKVIKIIINVIIIKYYIYSYIIVLKLI